LGGEHESAHYTQQRDACVVQFAARPPAPSDPRPEARYGVQGLPYRRKWKIIGNNPECVSRRGLKLARSYKPCYALPRATGSANLAIPMSDLSRIGVAIDTCLLKKFGQLVASRGYTNRSEAFRDLIRDELVEKMWERPDASVVGTVTPVYNHRAHLLNEKLTDLQHSHVHNMRSTVHLRLDHDNCLEVRVVKGKAGAVKKIADTLISAKGVKHGPLTMSSTGAEL